MSKSIFIKILICSIFVLILSSSFYLPSYALGDIFSEGKDFLEKGKDIDQTINTAALEETSDYIYNTLLGIAIMVAIIVAMILGIQFMAASADEKAKVKEAIMPFVVGCIVVFGAFTIWKIAVNIGNNAENSVVTGTVFHDVYTYNKDNDSNRISKWQEGEQLRQNGKLENCSKEELLTYYYVAARTGNNGTPLREKSKEILKNKYNTDISSVEFKE